MSLINQVLLDLDRRQASHAALPSAARSVLVRRQGLRWARGVGLLLALGAGVAIAVVATQAMPEAYRLPAATRPASLAPPASIAALATQASEPKALSAASQPAPALSTSPPTNIAGASPLNFVPPTAAATALVQAPVAMAIARLAPVTVAQPSTLAEAPSTPRAAAPERSVDASPALIATNVEKRLRPLAPQERAELEYQRGVALHQQGQTADAQVAFRAAVREDPRYGPARHAVALGLLLDANLKEAQVLLVQGLELNPHDVLLASALARITADEDLSGATALLKAALPARAGAAPRTEPAEARALLATLQQRGGSHAEAIDNYSAALRLAPDNGAWWIGLGISLAAVGRTDGARQAFERARSTDTLSPELVRYVEQRLASATR